MTKFELDIPDPTRLRVGKEAYVTLKAGTEVHRVHPSIYGPCEFNPTSLGNARFSPIRDRKGNVIPTIYAAEASTARSARLFCGVRIRRGERDQARRSRRSYIRPISRISATAPSRSPAI